MIVTESYTTPEQIIGACVATKALAPAECPPDLPTSPLLSGEPGWYDFEEQAWPIGEAIHRSLKAKSQLRRDTSVTQAIFGVIGCRNLRRGRQSFVLALGYTTASQHAAGIAALLSDPDICGHVVDTLLKMQVSGYELQVAELARHQQPWVRRLSRRYVARYGVPPDNSFKPKPLRGSA